MSKRLQVLLDDKEWHELRRAARARRLTVAEWVRQALRTVRRGEPAGALDEKIQAVRRAARHEFPTADIGRMLAEIERGYAGEAPG